MNEKLREKLAELEHNQWAHWTQYLLRHLTPRNEAHWYQQMATPYASLTEEEKESDREWADKVIDILQQYGHRTVSQVGDPKTGVKMVQGWFIPDKEVSDG